MLCQTINPEVRGRQPITGKLPLQSCSPEPRNYFSFGSLANAETVDGARWSSFNILVCKGVKSGRRVFGLLTQMAHTNGDYMSCSLRIQSRQTALSLYAAGEEYTTVSLNLISGWFPQVKLLGAEQESTKLCWFSLGSLWEGPALLSDEYNKGRVSPNKTFFFLPCKRSQSAQCD